jgi:U3 small nucleolar ribonucleoprotein protein LCP5
MQPVLLLLHCSQSGYRCTSASTASSVPDRRALTDSRRARNSDVSLDLTSGLSLLLLRPHLLLTSLHHLVILLALRLSSLNASHSHTNPDASSSTALTTPFAAPRSRRDLKSAKEVEEEIAGELVLVQEVMEKVRGLESKVEYQVKKLMGLADTEDAREKGKAVEDVEEGRWCFSAYHETA